MGKFGKTLIGKLTGSDKSCCCCGPSIVSIRTIRFDDKDLNVAGLNEEFKKHFEAGKTPENIDTEELMKNLLKINVVPENELENFEAAILKEYVTYWQGNKH